MMCLLRNRFDDFYAEYGCFLWTVVTVQALSLLIQTTINALLNYNKAVIDFQYESKQFKPVLHSIFRVIYNIVAFIVPMLTQLSCLIFVWIRSNGGADKFKKPNLAKNQIVLYLEKSQQRRPDYISVFDPTVEYYMVDVAKYKEKLRWSLPKAQVEENKSSNVTDQSSLLISDDDKALNLNN